MLEIMPKEDGDIIFLTLPYIKLGGTVPFTEENKEKLKEMYDLDDLLDMLIQFNSTIRP